MKHLQPHLLSDGALFERSSFAGLLKFLRTAKNINQTNHFRGNINRPEQHADSGKNRPSIAIFN
jgi:hypothetical protein